VSQAAIERSSPTGEARVRTGDDELPDSWDWRH